MQKLIFITLLFTININAQVFDVETLQFNGEDSKFINLVILGDGYQANEQDDFITDAVNFKNALFNENPYNEYQNYFNVYAIKVISNESGVNHPANATDVSEPVFPAQVVDNYFGSTFDYFSIHRLLVPTNNSAIAQVLAANFPAYDQVVFLVNTPHYGGSGGQYATTSLNSSANEIAIHEIGHSFVNLRDEYYAGDVFAAESINMTQQTNPTLVRWKNWYNNNGIGIYPHCCGGDSSNWYKPHQNCKMQYLGFPFCAVCVEATVEKIHTLVNPIIDYLPLNDVSNPIFPLDFSASILAPNPNTLTVKWQLNNIDFQTNVDAIQVNQNDLISGTNTLTLSVIDNTLLVRTDNHETIHINTVTWDITNTLGLENITSENNRIKVEVYPNPTTDLLTISLTNDLKKVYRLELFNLEGKLVLYKKDIHETLTSVDISKLQQGTYFLKIYLENSLVISSTVLKE